MARLSTYIAIFAWAVALAATKLHAAVQAPQEGELKSVLLFRLTQFVTWPNQATNGTGNDFRIGLLGPDPFGDALSAVVKGEKVGNRPIVVKKSMSPSELLDCDVVYFSGQYPSSVTRAIEVLSARPILTVGETQDFLANGGMVRMKLTDAKKIKLQIALDSARKQGLKLSAQLLRVSEVIGGSK